MKANTSKSLGLFLGTFVSAFLLVFGVGTMLSSYWPAVIGLITPNAAYQPQLPIAQAREEAFLDIQQIPPKELYPPLGQVEGVQPGNWIHIPSIDVHVPLALSPSMQDADVIKTLNHGVALYPNGIAPGRLGNTFIAAHSTGNPWQGQYRFAFLRLNEVENGNIIHLDYKGTRYTYRVFDTQLVTPDPNFRVISDRPRPTMTLMACWPLWTADQRTLKHAELVNVTKLTPEPF